MYLCANCKVWMFVERFRFSSGIVCILFSFAMIQINVDAVAKLSFNYNYYESVRSTHHHDDHQLISITWNREIREIFLKNWNRKIDSDSLTWKTIKLVKNVIAPSAAYGVRIVYDQIAMIILKMRSQLQSTQFFRFSLSKLDGPNHRPIELGIMYIVYKV